MPLTSISRGLARGGIHLRKKWVMLALVVAGLMLCASASARTMYLNRDAKLYKKNSTESKVLKELGEGLKVNALAVKKGWAKVKVGGVGGYMASDALSEKAPGEEGGEDAPAAETTMYAAEQVKLRKAASDSAKAIQTLKAGTQVTLTAKKGKWGKVKVGAKAGYVLLSKLSENKPDASAGDDAEAPNAPSGQYETLKPGDSGEAVEKLQTRLKALEWFYGDIGGNYKDLTTQAVKDFQEAADLKISGIADAATQEALYAKDAPKNVIDSTAAPASGSAKEMDWWTSGIQELFPRGATVVVTDVVTKLSWRVYRSGGTNHADVQPKTAQDTAVMKKAYGGAWSWNRRAIWVSINGNKYAASMNGMPHGSGSITSNNFDGHHCIHFTNSRTHGSNVIDAMHQDAIRRAAQS